MYHHNHRVHYCRVRVCYNHDWRPWPTLISDDNALQLFRLYSYLSCINNPGNSSSNKDSDNDPNYQGTGSIIGRSPISSSLEQVRDMVSVRISMVIRDVAVYAAAARSERLC